MGGPSWAAVPPVKNDAVSEKGQSFLDCSLLVRRGGASWIVVPPVRNDAVGEKGRSFLSHSPTCEGTLLVRRGG